jgi:short-subunit dehydrogenase
VQLNSVASLKNFADFATYCASKAAAYSITQALREELASQNTLVVSVHPGPIKTDMASDAGLAEMADPPEVVSEAIVAALEAGTFHVFPDTMARQFGEAYASFAENIIEASIAEPA